MGLTLVGFFAKPTAQAAGSADLLAIAVAAPGAAGAWAASCCWRPCARRRSWRSGDPWARCGSAWRRATRPRAPCSSRPGSPTGRARRPLPAGPARPAHGPPRPGTLEYWPGRLPERVGTCPCPPTVHYASSFPSPLSLCFRFALPPPPAAPPPPRHREDGALARAGGPAEPGRRASWTAASPTPTAACGGAPRWPPAASATRRWCLR